MCILSEERVRKMGFVMNDIGHLQQTYMLMKMPLALRAYEENNEVCEDTEDPSEK